jgi:hypothetical protein
MEQHEHEQFLADLYKILDGADDIYAEVSFNHIYVEWFRYNELFSVSVRGKNGNDFMDLAQATLRLVRDKDSDETRIKKLLDQLMAIEVK